MAVLCLVVSTTMQRSVVMCEISEVCRKVSEWKLGFDFVAISKYGTVRWLSCDSAKSFDGNVFSREEISRERARITGKPMWPRFSKSGGEHSMMQTKVGNWYLVKGVVDPNCEKSIRNMIDNGSRVGFGAVLGDWKKTLDVATYA